MDDAILNDPDLSGVDFDRTPVTYAPGLAVTATLVEHIREDAEMEYDEEHGQEMDDQQKQKLQAAIGPHSEFNADDTDLHYAIKDFSRDVDPYLFAHWSSKIEENPNAKEPRTAGGAGALVQHLGKRLEDHMQYVREAADPMDMVRAAWIWCCPGTVTDLPKTGHSGSVMDWVRTHLGPDRKFADLKILHLADSELAEIYTAINAVVPSDLPGFVRETEGAGSAAKELAMGMLEFIEKSLDCYWDRRKPDRSKAPDYRGHFLWADRVAALGTLGAMADVAAELKSKAIKGA